ncbi:phosphoribosylanthranilate isomerase [Acetobacter oeni]|uniref:N-(5'-phosphoribosyl)anthranilate isomerase n=1 Tax=Acetobacter oeni TaxID=304077 RepID=A0A511XPW6_9PROT|nr:phosphoribosylanthranilate isomerase [Acetobacter oeni]MBB3883652.1 phosphoribosylanthranilate isomerase [Acetobacter oeni]NHO19614.1 N-(5'-phosphoribosyl)anthranilate isomerase [Acetobacter oeni]GBR09950.1 phosphoribosyl anthranilate isomerase [Acetobacter oeni LMG 21952]GEN64991.1 N-(5'-phosphoribosyl)anthranilate isomerase [Acetobacter oeni]
MTVKVKICGLTDEAGVRVCLEHRVDWLGFNFFTRSPRYVTLSRAAELIRLVRIPAAPPGCVGLFVEPSDAEIAEALREVPLDVLQLYTSAERASEIRTKFGRKVWRSCPVSSEADLPLTTGADALIIESCPPPEASRPGGNGAIFPWGLAHGWKAPAPWLLAGGLNPGNVARAIVESGAKAVDVSSGVEAAPGVKDSAAIASFVIAARQVVSG